MSADGANRIGEDYVRRNCLVFYKFLFSSTVGVELRGTSTTLDPPPRIGISPILVVNIKTKQEDRDARIYETSAQSYVSK